MTDGSTGQIATGAVAEGDTVGVLGTTLVLKAVSPHDVVESASGVYSHGAPDGTFWPGGASNTGAGVLRHGLTAGLDPADAAAAIEAHGASGIIAYPLARPGERFPVADPAFPGFCVDHAGRARDATTAVERFRAVYEGVALVERLGLDRLSGLGVRMRRHHVAGGASASPVWNRIRASALGREVVAVSGAGSARGAAAIAAAALDASRPGAEGLDAVARRFSGVRTVIEPDPALAARLDEHYRILCAHIPSASRPHT
ncbi:FGGY-family carbohydrate kinase [Microbacterium elymi]|uniref:FGGY-family carbohydrate kinase n=1 Tax=Microbacterium elymi TaxID=2909587 RepID=A0ABY5NIQ3_9MICO|nr:FGGY-family carbohydrate kinase [Microbacterium elymi]UUT35050.1 FGGY-family carbohydrate kinase [Microbacterium elymi]